MKKIIIDTDIGDDADDVLALAYALTLKEIDLLGVTTVFKNSHQRAQMASHLLALAGRTDVPVRAGEGHSYNKRNLIDETPCQFQTMMDQYDVSGETALSFYQKTLQKQRVSIVAIGPLTNLAKLIEASPELINNIDEIILMGGCYYRHVNEWNIVCDPEAADIVFRSGIPLIGVGLDVTTRCQFDSSYLDVARRNANTPLKKLLLQSCDAWFEHSGFTPILHDPLAIHALTRQEVIGFTPEHVNVELSGQYTRGMTVCGEEGIWGREADNPNITVASTIDGDAFTQHFLDTVFIQS